MDIERSDMLIRRKIQEEFNRAERYSAFIIQFFDALGYRNISPYRESKTSRSQVLSHVLERIRPKDGELCLEFGVYKGDSIRYVAGCRPSVRFYGFDSFEGFPEDGRKDWHQDFSVSKLPDVPQNATLVKGYFDKTLPVFIDTHPGKVCFINVDCDIYSSTRFIFDCLAGASRFRIGTIIYFDELINYDGFLGNELQALFELLEATSFGIDALWIHQHLMRLEESLELLESGSFERNWKVLQGKGYRQQAAVRLTGGGVQYGPLLTDKSYEKRVRRIGRRTERYMNTMG